MGQKERDPLFDKPEALATYGQALQGFIHALCKGLRSEDCPALAKSIREHEGLIVFNDKSGGMSFEVKVTFRKLMDYPETMALIGALAEKNGPSCPVTFAGDPGFAAEVLKKVNR